VTAGGGASVPVVEPARAMPNAGSASAIADEQAALRRVATLVASGAEPAEVFHAVAEEAGRLLGARSSATIRYDGDTALTVGRWQHGEEPTGFRVGTRVPLTDSDGLTAVVARTGRSARIDDYTGLRGRAAEMMRQNGFHAAVAAPIVVDGATWGLLLVTSVVADTLGADAERRLGDFAELVALALESAEAREQLKASRRRILKAAFDERRRLERNLHDGAQQRLVSLALQLRVLEGQLERDPEAARGLVAGARAELVLAMQELRELARGLHPAVLSERGLAAALESLAASAALPVHVSGASEERLGEAVEAGAYFVIAESITNAVKHADAARIEVRLARAPGALRIEIEDDGRGGADPAAGTGLRGLSDRVEALGGRFSVADRDGGGTVVAVELPVSEGDVV
jgi:signal transduction histidine kinase